MQYLRNRPFAAKVQATLIVLMLISFILMVQRLSINLYRLGLLMLFISGFAQFAFGNISSTANFKQSIKFLVLVWAIIAAVFGLGIILVPYLVNLGQGG